VSLNDVFVHTDTLQTTSSAYHSFNDGGTHWESLTFKNQEDKGVTAFIAQNSGARLKVSLSGKKPYIYYMADADKKAISETYQLWIVKKDVAQLHKEIRKAKAKIDKINRQKKI
jgi:hypothetical protein